MFLTTRQFQLEKKFSKFPHPSLEFLYLTVLLLGCGVPYLLIW